MQKLQELKRRQQEQQKQQQQQLSNDSERSPSEPASSGSSSSTGFVLKRSSSKELADKRRQKSKENLLSLRRSNGTKKDKKKQSSAELRVHKDISEMDAIPGTRLDFPDANNLMLFHLYVTPNDGLYKGAEFKFTITIPTNYPYEPPKAQCDTLIYHPNIDFDGHVCLNILRADWLPVLNIGSIIFGLVTLFLQPNPEDPLNVEVAKLMLDNRSQFERNLKQSLQGGLVAGRQFPKLLK